MTGAAPMAPAEMVAAWRAGVESLDPLRPPAPGIINREPGPNGREGVWGAVHEMMRRFLDERGEEAAALGWTTVRLFGVHWDAGAVRADSTGALVTLYPRRVVSMTDREIVLSRRGVMVTSREMTNPGESVPLWEFRGR